MSSTPNLVAQAAANAGIDPALALAVANQESGFNQSAISSAGAVGVMQLMPGTAAGLGVNPYDEASNIAGGVNYLASQLNAFGDPAQALAAYNWGPGNVQKAVARYGSNWLSAAPAETRNYVNSVLSAAGESSASVAPTSSPAISDDLSVAAGTSGLILIAAAGLGLWLFL